MPSIIESFDIMGNDLINSTEQWCEDVKNFAKSVKGNKENCYLPDFSGIVTSYRKIYKFYKEKSLKLRNKEIKRKAAENSKPEAPTTGSSINEEYANNYLSHYETYFEKLSEIMDKETLKNFNYTKIAGDIKNIKNNINLTPQGKINTFKERENNTIELANEYSTSLREEYLKEKSKGFRLDKLKKVKTIMVDMQNKIKEIKDKKVEDQVALEQLLDCMGEFSKKLSTATWKVDTNILSAIFLGGTRVWAGIIADRLFAVADKIKNCKKYTEKKILQ